MKNLRKVVSTFLSAAFIVGAVAACGNTTGTQPSGTGDQAGTGSKEYQIMGGMSPLSVGYDSNEVLNKLQTEAGITIEWDTMSSSLAEQVGIRIGGNQLPDAFMGVGFSNYDISTYGEDGVFIDLTPHINNETMPNLTAILEKHPDIKKAITMADGKIYGLPAGEQMGTAGIGDTTNHSIFTVPQFSMINKAWLDDLGLEVPQTIEELEIVLQAFLDNDMSAKYYSNEAGSTIPLSVGFDQWCWGQNVFYAPFGFTNWTNDVINDIVVNADGKVEFVNVTDAYRDALTWFNSLYTQGLVDLEMFSQDTSQYIAKTSQGRVGVAVWWYIEEVMADKSDDYVFLPPMTQADGSYNITVRDGGTINSGSLNITRACENPTDLLKFFDQWYEPENVMQLQYGPIDVFFTEKDESGKWISITDEQSREKFNKSAGELKGTHEVAGPKLILAEYYNENFYMEDRAIERLEDLKNFWMPFVEDPVSYPIDAVYSNEELEIIDLYKSDFESTVAEQEALWIRDGGPTDEEWEDYKTRLRETVGLEELLAVYQSAYDRYTE